MLGATKQRHLAATEDAEDTAVAKLTHGSLLARNTVWNLVGQVAPMGWPGLPFPC